MVTDAATTGDRNFLCALRGIRSTYLLAACASCKFAFESVIDKVGVVGLLPNLDKQALRKRTNVPDTAIENVVLDPIEP